MTTKNFNVKNGLTTGNIILDAASGNITATNANLGNLVTANYFSGSGNNLSNIQGANVSGAVASATSATTAGTVTTAAQPNITSVGTLSSLTVTANVAAGNILTDHLLYANGTSWSFMTVAGANTQVQYNNSGAFGASSDFTFNNSTKALTVTGNISGGNVSGTTVTGTNLTGTLTTAAQPNITSVGTLTSLAVTGNITAGNANLGNLVTANYFSGSGNNLSNIQAANITGQVANALVAGTVYTAAQPNITSVGTLTSVTVSGDASISGNLTVGGTTSYVNVTTLDIKDPIIEIGGGSNGAALTTNDSKDRGTLLHYYSGGVIDAFMGWDNSNAEFAFGSNVAVTGEVVTFNSLGNVRVGNIIGNGQALTGINGSNVTGQVANALVAGTVYTNAQPNITSVGTLSSLTVGNATANVKITTANGNGFLTATGNITAPYFIGNVVGNISGTITVPGNNTAVLYNNAGNAGASDAFKFDFVSNVLTVVGNIVSTNANLGNLATANYFSGSGNNLSNIQAANITGQVANALVAGTVYTAAQPNITSVGTLTSLTVTGTATSGNVSSGNLTLTGNISGANNVTANFFIGNGSSLSAIAGANVTGQVGNALVAGTVYTAAQPNITSVGTLTSVAVTGNATVGNIVVNGGLLSNRANVSATSATVIDQFPPTTYRTAKYVVSASGTNGYQSVEALLVHNGTNSYITIYGSLCSNNSTDIIDLTSDINGVSGNVSLYATSLSGTATVNLVATYLKT